MILVDGEASDGVAVDDRGLAYGDGLFETLALWRGRVLALELHLERLQRDAARLRLAAIPLDTVREEITRICSEQDCGVLRITVTRGSGGRGYRPPAATTPRRIIALHPWPADLATLSDDGHRAFLCRHPLSSNAVTAGIKHLNRLDQVLASAEWPGPEFFEGLMCDAAGHLIEGTRSNLFVVFGARIVTPALDHCGVAGVVRAAIIEHCRRHGPTLEVRTLEPGELAQADAMFLSNSIMGVRTLASVAGQADLPRAARGYAVELREALRERGVIA